MESSSGTLRLTAEERDRSLANLKLNLKTAQTFTPLSKEERRQLASRVSGSLFRITYLQPGYWDA